MAGTIKLPFIGEVKTSYAVIGGMAVAGIVGYAYYRHAQSGGSSSSGTSSSSSSGIDPQTGYPYGSAQDTQALAALNGTSNSDIDPQTGYPYGSEQDTEALSALNGGEYGYAPEGGGYYGYEPTTTTPTTTTKTVDKYAVPNVVGGGQTRAISAIKNAGLVPDPSITIPGDGNVTSQSPAAGTEVAKGTIVHWDAKQKSKPHPKPAHHQKSFIAAGTTSLNDAARLRHVKTQTVIDDTRANRPGPRVLEYLSHGDWNKKLPRGSKWFY